MVRNLPEPSNPPLENNPIGVTGRSDFLIVGIGASAGGIAALRTFFMNVPADSGMAYVVILHLSPDFESHLAEVLQSVCDIPVKQVTRKVRIRPDHVYVVPPNKHLMMQDGSIAVLTNTQVEDRRAPIDIFFRTLADSDGTNAVCVVLSGTGANGSMGLKRIKERGGTTFVQDPEEAEFDEMPRNAIATELADQVLRAAEIPEKLIAYKNGRGTIQIPLDVEERPAHEENALRDVFTQLRIQTGHDFSNYKRPTLLRRIERRVNIHNLSDLPSYAAFLKQHPGEIKALLKDLLISVTNFFRDHEAFEALNENALAKIIRDKTSEDEVRIWAVGCATGEEAYSLAILCAERVLSMIGAPKVQIFATDIDEAAIVRAREGLYTINDAADVSPERLNRFFLKENGGFRIRREIREMVLFAYHNVLKDPPFSHLDLVACRNMMIYLNRAAQKRVMETFHFALNAEGFLFLGASESMDGESGLYTVVNHKYHIFKNNQVAARPFPVPESVPAFRFEQPRQPDVSQEKETRRLDRVTFGDLHHRLLEQYAPPSVIINKKYDIVHLSERAGRYMEIAGGGEPSRNLLNLVRHELRIELRTALNQAVQQNTNVETKSLKTSIGGHTGAVTMHVRPVLRGDDTAHGFILVLFEETDETNVEEKEEIVLVPDKPVTFQLEEEITHLKTELRNSVEQYETQTEELKASNEELQAMNEELRSAAEELETSKEELQSINEELRTVNQELKVKIEEATLSGDNLRNLINSTSIGTIFLDRSFHVKLFTPAATDLFNLIPTDYGRPLSDITNRIEYPDIIPDAEGVLDTLQPLQREVCTNEGRVFMMRVLPYRTAEDHINGVVITFVDISEIKQAEGNLRRSENRYKTLFDSIDEGFCIIEKISDDPLDFRYMEANPAFAVQSGVDNVVGRSIREAFPGEPEEWLLTYNSVLNTGEPIRFERELTTQKKILELYVFRVKEGTNRRVSVLFRDITKRKIMERQKDEFMGVASHELKTPVTSIKAYTELLREQFEEANDDDNAKLMQKLDVQVDRLAELIHDLLDTTRISDGQLPLQREQFDLNNLISECVEDLQHTSQKHRVIFESGDIKQVAADRDRIRQVLTNLISNAIKYSPEGCEVTITSSPAENGIKVSIRDKGMGIPEEMQQKIFERFSRVDQIHPSSGMGLGLYIAAGIIQRHGGNISVKSEPGRGSIFSFILPCNDEVKNTKDEGNADPPLSPRADR